MKLSNFTVFADRCRGTQFPENTIEAMNALSKTGVTSISVSVQENLDGDIVVFHDETMDYMTNKDGFARYYDVNSLHEVNFKEELGGSKEIKIPTLSNFIEALIINGGEFNLCLEFRGFGLSRALKKCLDDCYSSFGNEEKIKLTVSSREQVDLVVFKKLMPGTKTMAIISGTTFTYAQEVADAGIDSIKIEGDFINKLLVRDAKARGLGVFAGTLTNERSLFNLTEMKVDGIFVANKSVLEALAQ